MTIITRRSCATSARRASTTCSTTCEHRAHATNENEPVRQRHRARARPPSCAATARIAPDEFLHSFTAITLQPPRIHLQAADQLQPFRHRQSGRNVGSRPHRADLTEPRPLRGGGSIRSTACAHARREPRPHTGQGRAAARSAARRSGRNQAVEKPRDLGVLPARCSLSATPPLRSTSRPRDSPAEFPRPVSSFDCIASGRERAGQSRAAPHDHAVTATSFMWATASRSTFPRARWTGRDGARRAAARARCAREPDGFRQGSRYRSSP